MLYRCHTARGVRDFQAKYIGANGQVGKCGTLTRGLHRAIAQEVPLESIRTGAGGAAQELQLAAVGGPGEVCGAVGAEVSTLIA